ncbi:MAG: DUF485 domain-containing protein [Gammaproteobacteria bacterium]|nr:MAG: DUF485 domain-containing protein [Gammaproteobacteria bacterium]
MGGHGPAVKLGKDNASGYKGALGIKLFIVYTIVYAIFVAINVYDVKIMEQLIGGQNVAVLYGFGLIVLALIMALFYNHLCGKAEKKLNG